ncbi:MAG: hypothetical protein VX044_09005, partial [Planctomycetota bacterium]|nr:hypothetical protein [Planctomycetota bacterium]
GAPDLGEPLGTLQGYVDRALFGDHIWVKGQYDPEGLLSTIPAIGTCMFGVEAGRWMCATPDAASRAAGLLRRGVCLLAAGAVWSWLLPWNKYLWTSSYAVWTAGVATAGLGLSVHVFEQRAQRWAAYPLQVYGTNALLVFVGSGLVGRVIASLITFDVGGTETSLKQWLFGALQAAIPAPRVASLAFAVAWVCAWFLVLRILFRRGVVWRV